MPISTRDLTHIPNSPGVYLMKGDLECILYIGKAIDLRKRVSQYFTRGRDERGMIPYLLSDLKKIDFILVTSEKEALLLERRLIQEHRPKYNSCLKDDSSFYLFHIDPKESWPKLRLIRAKDEISSTSLLWGPYTDSKSAREILDVLQGIFPLRRCSDQEFSQRKTPCLYYQIKRCPAPCVDLCSRDQYFTHVEAVIEFLNGKIHSVLNRLQSYMNLAADNFEFEHAAYLRDLHSRIESWSVSTSGQSVDAINNESADIFCIVNNDSSMLISRSAYREGRLMQMDHFVISDHIGDCEDILQTWILHYYMSIAVRPSIEKIVLCVDQKKEFEALSECLSEVLSRSIEIATPRQEPLISWARLLYLNALAKMQTLTGTAPLIKMEEMGNFFGLSRTPTLIECVDHSHLQGHQSVSAVIVSKEGKLDRNKYRRYNWGLTNGNDIAILRTFMMKRYKGKKEFPDLILIDGGKSHWNVAYECLQELKLTSIPLLALSKDQGKHTKGLTSEKLWGPSTSNFRILEPMCPYTLFIQMLRDEAHHVALSFQKKQRSKNQTKSMLDSIPGIGPKLKTSILANNAGIEQFMIDLYQGKENIKLPPKTRQLLLDQYISKKTRKGD
ncbi:excinuclease ABC subunit UvrC [Candidatus Similichlamydia epinepheli]|uniref:excinuclease ABC subunit UvrC n=1 Tax=Candidatus Similichlamydia epinepheli TaxID=1903953 RepID=UPI000D3D2BE0|nr:excinuclease ABC subunit UvrC [Candidatus Similichlamydia epinepheli]